MGVNFDLADLQAFHAVVESGNFRKAAEAISISQSALGRRIDKLESTLGVSLFEHTTHSIILTTVDRVFARNAKQLLDDLDVALLSIRDIPLSRLEQVTIACVPLVAYYFLPNLIVNYHRHFPHIRVKLLDASTNEMLGAVINGEADLDLSFMDSQEPEVEFKILLQEQFVTTCQRDHPLARRRRMTWKELYARKYVSVDKASGDRLLLDQALPAVAPHAPNICETWHATTMLRLVEAELGVATVPSMAMPGHGHPILASVPLVGPVVKRRAGIVKRCGRVLTPAVEEFHQMIIGAKRSGVTTGDA